jgi:hypothetical protein
MFGKSRNVSELFGKAREVSDRQSKKEEKVVQLSSGPSQTIDDRRSSRLSVRLAIVESFLEESLVAPPR